MAEQTPYFDSITADRAMLLTEEEQLAGLTTISMETQDMSEEGIITYIHENFAEFLKHVKMLKPEDREMVLSYYLLGKTQTSLAQVYKSTQTVCSFRLRLAIKTFCTFMWFGTPSAKTMRTILMKAGLEDSLPGISLSECVALYAEMRSFDRVANHYKIHRPHVRRTMSRASKALQESTNGSEQALGAYIFNLIDKANPHGVGTTKRQKLKGGNIVRRDPDILGEFRFNVMDPDFEFMFVSRASHHT